MKIRSCDNANIGGYNIVNPICWNGKATQRVEVIYSEVESDVVYLCDTCAQVLTKDAQRHGYAVKTKKIA